MPRSREYNLSINIIAVNCQFIGSFNLTFNYDGTTKTGSNNIAFRFQKWEKVDFSWETLLQRERRDLNQSLVAFLPTH